MTYNISFTCITKLFDICIHCKMIPTSLITICHHTKITKYYLLYSHAVLYISMSQGLYFPIPFSNFALPPFPLDFPGSSDGKASIYNAGDLGSIPGLGRSPGEGNGNPLQDYCLENPMDRGAWQATVHGVAKSQTRLSDFTHSLTPSLPSLWQPLIFSIPVSLGFILCVYFLDSTYG